MNPVPPQSYADSKYIHKQNPPPLVHQNTCRVLQLAKNISVKIEKDFSTKFWGIVMTFLLNVSADN